MKKGKVLCSVDVLLLLLFSKPVHFFLGLLYSIRLKNLGMSMDNSAPNCGQFYLGLYFPMGQTRESQMVYASTHDEQAFCGKPTLIFSFWYQESYGTRPVPCGAA